MRGHGGAASIAHPWTAVDVEAILPRLVEAGLVAIECYYGSHRAPDTARYRALAERFGLVPTGGSDFHGRGQHGTALAGVWVPPPTVDELERRRGTGGSAGGVPPRSSYHVASVEGAR